ncbi:hypothetical protein, partial [Massilia sp.]|uniref:hypothetical protein n=1 Tax=Massilia sp. TaxID=1882437 RepID=UPI00352EA66F
RLLNYEILAPHTEFLTGPKFFVVDPDIVLPNKKKSTDSGCVHDHNTCPTSTWPAAGGPKLPVPGPFVDKLLNIHRIECAELPRKSISNFFSSFGPRQKQGLFDRFRRT